MARRRPPPNTHPAHPPMFTDSPKLSKALRQRAPELGMSPEARYNHNLKVLRRRDPSIISIFDQFSHVCVYHHNGATWEKNGFEGSMFLYERDAYPPYGFYILNRMGMDDYIQRLYPEDVTGIHGTYLMLRSYPDFTSRRLSHILSAHDEPPEKFSDVYSIPNLDKLLDGDKGRQNTVGLWMFPTDAREPMIDVMMRLHSYIKRNVPYPEQFRYGPNRPPPPNPHLRTTSPSPPPEPHDAASGDNELDRSFPSGSASELDKLFARLNTAPASVSSPPPPPTQTKSRSTSTMTVASLFAALGGAELDAGDNDAPPPNSRSGIPLLDSIFASATPTPPPVPIHAPTPSPQILNHEVITSLLGLPPPRTASAAASSSSREGDNEHERASEGMSEGSTVLDPEAELDQELQAAGASAGRPLLSVPPPRNPPVVVNGGAAKVNGKGRAHGDATPRVNGHSTPARPPPSSQVATSPFAAATQLWQPVDDTADALEDGEIVELDFADTRALSDPDAFRAALARRGREPESSEGGGRERKGRKKGKRERAAERAAELEALRAVEEMTEEQLEPDPRRRAQWAELAAQEAASKRQAEARYAQQTDRERTDEVARLFQILDRSNVEQMMNARPQAPSSRSASASPPLEDEDTGPVRPPGLTPPPVLETPTTARPPMGAGSSSAAKGLDPARVRASVVATISAQAQRPAAHMERNDFVREVLTLIHTDKTFVDALWRDYTARVG
ncbi:hypothetical protein DFH09DRAFT_1375837 [Mycena vulgaris]|nr:hypothetical protein DFH09DRAFT_1375837 [Mycena vulgaris]